MRLRLHPAVSTPRSSRWSYPVACRRSPRSRYLLARSESRRDGLRSAKGQRRKDGGPRHRWSLSLTINRSEDHVLYTSHSQIVDAIQVANTAGVPYCFIGGVAAHIHSIRAGRGPIVWNNVDVLIDTTSPNILEMHRLFVQDLMMYPHPQGCPGIHAFIDPHYKTTFGGSFRAMFYSGLEEYHHNSIRLYAQFDPFSAKTVIGRAVEHVAERGDVIRIATIDDLLENKRIAVMSPVRSEEQHRRDESALRFLEDLIIHQSRTN